MQTHNSNSEKILRIEKALGYPYRRPESSFTFHSNAPLDFGIPASTEGRVPVLACGSNAAPDQLMRKFPMPTEQIVPVTCAKLQDFICVYSAHIAGYGAIPATLFWQPGSETNCHITWLSEKQLQRMHETEAIGVNYRFSRLTGISLECERTGSMTDIYAYISNFGSLQIDGQPVPIKGLTQDTSFHLSMSQQEVQEKVSQLIFQLTSSTEFITQNIDNPVLRRRRTVKLAQSASNFSYPEEDILLNTPLPGQK